MKTRPVASDTAYYNRMSVEFAQVGSQLKARSDAFNKEKDENFESMAMEILGPNSPIVTGGGGAHYPPLIDIAEEDKTDDKTIHQYANVPEDGMEVDKNEKETCKGGGDSGFDTVLNKEVSTLLPSAPSPSVLGSPQYNSTTIFQPSATAMNVDETDFHGFSTLPSVQVITIIDWI